MVNRGKPSGNRSGTTRKRSASPGAGPEPVRRDATVERGPWPDQALTPEQAAELLQVSVESIRAWVADGLIPHLRIKRTIRFSLNRLLELLAAGGVLGETTGPADDGDGGDPVPPG